MQENCTFSINPYGITMSKIILYKKRKGKSHYGITFSMVQSRHLRCHF